METSVFNISFGNLQYDTSRTVNLQKCKHSKSLGTTAPTFATIISSDTRTVSSEPIIIPAHIQRLNVDFFANSIKSSIGSDTVIQLSLSSSSSKLDSDSSKALNLWNESTCSLVSLISIDEEEEEENVKLVNDVETEEDLFGGIDL